MAKKTVVNQKIISVKVDDALYRQIELTCSRHDSSIGEAVTNLLTLWANNYLPERYDKYLY